MLKPLGPAQIHLVPGCSVNGLQSDKSTFGHLLANQKTYQISKHGLLTTISIVGILKWPVDQISWRSEHRKRVLGILKLDSYYWKHVFLGLVRWHADLISAKMHHFFKLWLFHPTAWLAIYAIVGLCNAQTHGAPAKRDVPLLCECWFTFGVGDRIRITHKMI